MCIGYNYDVVVMSWCGATPHTQNYPAPDPNPHPTLVAPVPDTPPHTTSTPTVVADCHGVKWYNSKDIIDLDEVPSFQWKFTNQFGDPFYPNSGVCMSRLDAWLIMYGKKIASFFDNTNLELRRQGRSTFKDMYKAFRFQGVLRLETHF